MRACVTSALWPCGGKSYSTRRRCVLHIRLEHGKDSSLTPIRRTLEEQKDNKPRRPSDVQGRPRLHSQSYSHSGIAAD
jgi:hypothetical protein